MNGENGAESFFAELRPAVNDIQGVYLYRSFFALEDDVEGCGGQDLVRDVPTLEMLVFNVANFVDRAVPVA